MVVIINNSDFILPTATNLESALLQHGLQNKLGIAVAVNELVIPKNQWNSKILNENDKILIITPTQGG